MMHYPDIFSGRVRCTMNFCRSRYVRRCEGKPARKSLYDVPFVRASSPVSGRLSFHGLHRAFLVRIKHSHSAIYEAQEVRSNVSTVVIAFNNNKVFGVLLYSCGR